MMVASQSSSRTLLGFLLLIHWTGPINGHASKVKELPPPPTKAAPKSDVSHRTWTSRSTGIAKIESGKVAYIEEIRETLVQKKDHPELTAIKIQYYSSDHKHLLAELEAEFKNPLLPNYHFKDHRFGIEDRFTLQNDGVHIYRKDETLAEPREKTMKLEGVLVAGAGMYNFLTEKLDQINEEKPLEFKFIIAAELDAYDFRVKQVKEDSDQKHWKRLRLEIDNWVLRIFAPKIEIVYDLNTKKAIEFIGPANVRDDAGDRQKVKITYTTK